MSIATLDPLQDPRWPQFIEEQPRASVFHSRGWLEALQRTYGYRAAALTTSLPGQGLENALLFCEVKSWLTGRRLVSLPFSDHCEPLVESSTDLGELCAFLAELKDGSGWKYVELRPCETPLAQTGFAKSDEYYLHRLHLQPSLDDLFRGLHPDSTRRRIRRAERENLTCQEGRSEDLLRAFYYLQMRTRRRHGLPPQPFAWFRNLSECLAESLTVRVARKDDTPIAAVMTLHFRDTVVYKYGGSDERFHKLGAMPLLFWNMIQQAKTCGAAWLDLGRSDCDDKGLITFKEHLGAKRQLLTYWRYPARAHRGNGLSIPGKLAKAVLRNLPASLLQVAGEWLYRHMA